MLNELQAHHLLRSFMKSDLITQAELATGTRLTVGNAPTFLAEWATSLADGDSGPVLDALADAEQEPPQVAPVAPVAPVPSVPAATHPYNSSACGGKPEPKRWAGWSDMQRKSYLDRQVDRETYRKALSIPEAASNLGVTPWILYALCDPGRTGKATADVFVRCGHALGVDAHRLDELRKMVS